MAIELLDVGSQLTAIWAPPTPNGQAGGEMGWDSIESITVDRLPGPMGWFLVAVIVRSNGKPEEILPLHMAQTIVRKGR